MAGYFGAGGVVAVGGWLTGCVATGATVGCGFAVAVAATWVAVGCDVVPDGDALVEEPPVLAC